MQFIKKCISDSIQYIFDLLMEDCRRKLRNKNNCPQISNIFNLQNGRSQLSKLVPPEVLSRIGRMQNITCNNIIQIPELNFHHSFEQEFKKCRIAQEYQRNWQNDTVQNSITFTQKPTRSEEVKEEVNHISMSIDDLICLNKQENLRQIKSKNHLWQDMNFLSNLNDFIMIDNSKDVAKFMADDLLQK